MLSGAASTTSNEITRDRMVPYVDADKAEVVYPVAIKESWNAIGCCDDAAKEHIDDVGYIKALVPKIDPGTPGRSTWSATASAGGWRTGWRAPTRRCSTGWRR